MTNEKKTGYRLVALDMDGTLLMSDKSVHPDTIRDIEAADERGIHVVYCSGRAIPEMMPYVPYLKAMRYAVCMSGALVYDFYEKKVIYRKAIAREHVEKILDAAQKTGGMVHFLTEEESIVCADQVLHMEDFHMGVYQQMFLEITRPVEDMGSEAQRHDFIPKVNVYFRSPKARQQAYGSLRHLPLAFAFAEETNLEMTADGVTKAEGLKELAKYLGIPMQNTLAVGDADNDRAMLGAAGFSVAMGNAKEEIRKLCDAITKDNDHNGVGEAIRKYVL